jgi:SpoVK/Ycf46/Vps4 family AAA+-type ATPase
VVVGEAVDIPAHALAERIERPHSAPSLDGGLQSAFEALDVRLAAAVSEATAAFGSDAGSDPFRGLYVTSSDVERLLTREPGAPLFRAHGLASELDSDAPDPSHSSLSTLGQAFGLSTFDLDVVVIALAPEVDLRYERLYAYLQDDVARRRPTVDLALNLLCASRDEKLSRRGHFMPEGPLVRCGLLHVDADGSHTQPPLLAHNLRLDEQIIRRLLQVEGLDSRLISWCELVDATGPVADLPASAESQWALPRLVEESYRSGQPLRLYFCGPPGAGQRPAAEALAVHAGAPLLVANLLRGPSAPTEVGGVLEVLFLEAERHKAVLYVDGIEGLDGRERAVSASRLLDALPRYPGPVILTGDRPWRSIARRSLGVVEVPFPVLDTAQRRAHWQAALEAVGQTLPDGALDTLGRRFRLTPGQIVDAVDEAYGRARLRAAAAAETYPSLLGEPGLNDLFVAARAQTGYELADLALKIEPVYTWDDLVLADDALTELREICDRAAHGHRVLAEWGFDRKLSGGKGIAALFTGPSGTGKTMAAEVIANELGLDLYRINLAGVVSKYIGETEKNLDGIFTAAENTNAILFFDEADALFGKRSEIHDSHDRYANIEISYLLQRMERYEGIAILATNLRGNLDEAFTRRLTFTVHFPYPDDVNRRRLWETIWPAAVPLADDVDADFLSSQFKLSGGNVRNIALAAAFLAAADQSTITMPHLLRAVRREYQKLGKLLSEAELQRDPREVAP